MSFSLVSGAVAKAGAANGTTTSGIDTTGAKLIVASLAYNNGVTPTLSDSKGNTWTALTATSNGSTRSTRIYYCINPSVGSGHTFTFGPSSVLGALVVSAWSASGNVTFDQEVGGHGSGNSITVAGVSAGVTPAHNNSLLVTGFGFGAQSVTASAGTGWTLVDKQDGAGGTNFGVGAVYQIQTSATAIGASDVIGTVTAGDNTDRTAVFYEASSETISITTPVQYKVFQRSGSTGSITITGSVTGATEDIEASFNGGAYVTIASSVAPGSFSGTLTGQAQGQGTLTVRKKTTTTTSATVSDVGIGDVFMVGGDSISEGRATNAQSYSHATLKATAYNQAGNWINGNDPVDTGTSNGSHWPLLATQIMADQGVPVAFITTGTGSTDVAGSANSWAKNNTEYANAISKVTAAATGGVRAVLMHLGPNAVVNASTLSKATYSAALSTLAGNFAADISGAPKTHIVVCGEVSTGSPPDRRAALDNIRGAVIENWDAGGNVRLGPCLISDDYSDGVHPKSDAEMLVVAKRWWIALRESIYSVSSGRGPRLSSASWDTARTNLTVVFDRALKTGLTFATAAWKVSDNGASMTVSSVAYHGTNPNAVVITTSAAATGPVNTTTVTFASGEDAKGVVIPLSTDITVPSGTAIQLPAEPIYAAAVGEYSVQPTGIASTEAFGTPALTPSVLTAADINAILDAQADIDAEGNPISIRGALRILLSFAAGNTAGGPGSLAFQSLDGTKIRIAGTADRQGNRTFTTLDGSA